MFDSRTVLGSLEASNSNDTAAIRIREYTKESFLCSRYNKKWRYWLCCTACPPQQLALAMWPRSDRHRAHLTGRSRCYRSIWPSGTSNLSSGRFGHTRPIPDQPKVGYEREPLGTLGAGGITAGVVILERATARAGALYGCRITSTKLQSTSEGVLEIFFGAARTARTAGRDGVAPSTRHSVSLWRCGLARTDIEHT
jgi:hypothetical protein